MKGGRASLSEGQIRKRILGLVSGELGPARRVQVVAFADSLGAEDGEALVARMIARGQLEQYDSKRGTRWGVPKPVRR